MRPTCSTCRWFLPAPTIDLTNGAPHGECRRLPPTRNDIQTAQGIGQLSGWPTTKRAFWCGEHTPTLATVGDAA
jgi:hypothetical protein